MNRIRVNDSHDLYKRIDLGSIDPSILSAIDKLEPAVHLAMDCYVQTMNTEAHIAQLSRLTLLRVCILHETRIFPHEGAMLESFGGDPFRDVAKSISNNPRLKHLHINLQIDSWVNDHVMFSTTKDHSLETIGRHVTTLHSLALEGDLRFTGKALETSTPHLHLLQPLSIIGIPLIEEIAKCLRGQVPTLQALTLSTFKDI